jgi:hypothetical protein
LYEQRALKQLLLGAVFVKRSMRLCQTAKPVVSASCAKLMKVTLLAQSLRSLLAVVSEVLFFNRENARK